MAPLEPWEKVLINAEDFQATEHGQMACTDCHGGVQSADKGAAHEGLIASPSDDPSTYCGSCHEEVTAAVPNSLHGTLAGYWTAIDARTVPENHPQLEEMFGNHCASCHASCGDCHISRPRQRRRRFCRRPSIQEDAINVE